MNDELSEKQLHYLYTAYWGLREFDGWMSIILQHLWLENGATLQHGSIRYAALGILAASYRELFPEWRLDHCEFISGFHSRLSEAIRKETVTENDFFGLVFVLYSVSILGGSECYISQQMYIRGIVDVLTFLMGKSDASRLRCLWRRALSVVRTYDSDQCLLKGGRSLGMELHVLSEKMSDISSFDRRLTALSDWKRGIVTQPPWSAIDDEFENLLHSLRATFDCWSRSLEIGASGQGTSMIWIVGTLESIGRQIEELTDRIHYDFLGNEQVLSPNFLLV